MIKQESYDKVILKHTFCLILFNIISIQVFFSKFDFKQIYHLESYKNKLVIQEAKESQNMWDPTQQTYITNLIQVSRDKATFTITNRTNHKIQIIIHPGSINKPVDSKYQDTVVIKQKRIILNPRESKNEEAVTRCYTKYKDDPNNIAYMTTKIIDYNINQNFNQKMIWQYVQNKVSKSGKSQNEVLKIIKRMKNTSQILFLLIQNKKIKFIDAEIQNGFINIILQDFRDQYYFLPPEPQNFTKDSLKIIKNQIGKDYLPGVVQKLPNKKIKIKFSTQIDQNGYIERIDIISKKQALLKLFYNMK